MAIFNRYPEIFQEYKELMNTEIDKNLINYIESIKNYKIKKDVKVYRHDDTFKKIVNELNKGLIDWFNSIIKKFKKNYRNYQLKYLERHQMVKTEEDRKDLENPIKKILSRKFNLKYKKYVKKHNEDIINNFLSIMKNEEIYEEINELIDLKFKDWISFFLKKKESNYNCTKFDGTHLQKILNKNKNKDFFSFVYCLYNYEIYLKRRKTRKPRKHKKKDDESQ